MKGMGDVVDDDSHATSVKYVKSPLQSFRMTKATSSGGMNQTGK